MRHRRFLALLLLESVACLSNAQPTASPLGDDIDQGIDRKRTYSLLSVKVNSLSETSRQKLNTVAANYSRSNSRGAFGNIARAALTGGITGIVNVLGSEIANITKIRSRQKKAWQEMRQKECLFVDSLESVRGQSDFYRSQSTYGPLDPTDMNFDGITLRALREGQDVLKMVCHIDTTRFDHMFLHSKFYLVVDTIEFYPYRSFLPNFQALKINEACLNTMRQDDRDYWETISHFDFNEYQRPSINISMDIFSSWINEWVQIQQDVKLGNFSVNIPVTKEQLRDSVYFYSRKEALANHTPTVDMQGECFVVPRSYMPVAANNPSWGTGEYRMKVVISEKATYNPTSSRSTNWHRDYKQLVRMQNGGKAKNEYWQDIVSTMRDNKGEILKATYTPVFTAIGTLMGVSPSPTGAAGVAGAAGIPGGGPAQMPGGK